MRSRFFQRAFPCAILVAGLAGCTASASPSPPDGGDDGPVASCPVELCSPYTCLPASQRCRTSCTGPESCVAGFVCEDGLCFGTECTEATAVIVCGAYACIRGTCSHDCALGPCNDGYYCRGDTNECVPLCTSRGDPVCQGYVCDREVGECEPYCLDGEIPCAAGHVCDSTGGCVPDASAPPCAAGCGVYACVQELGRCGTHCVEDDDCVAPFVCADGACVDASGS